MPWDGGLLPSPPHYTDDIVSASAAQKPAGFLGRPAHTGWAVSLQSSRSGPCRVVSGIPVGVQDPCCPGGCHRGSTSLPHNGKWERGSGFCGSSGTSVNFCTPLSARPSAHCITSLRRGTWARGAEPQAAFEKAEMLARQITALGISPAGCTCIRWFGNPGRHGLALWQQESKRAECPWLLVPATGRGTHAPAGQQ